LDKAMRKTWVFLLAALAFAAGAFGTMAYVDRTSKAAGMHNACEMLNRAEASKALTRQQRNDIVEHVQLRQNTDDGSLIRKFKSRCP